MLLFQGFFDDIPLGDVDLLVMDDCALFADKKTSEGVYSALQSELDLIEEWANQQDLIRGSQMLALSP